MTDTAAPPVTGLDLLARCIHCGQPTPGVLADCDQPACQRADAALIAAIKRLEDQ